jgi:hypothetical protein
MTHPSPITDPSAARVDDDHTIVVPPEDRCLVVLDGLRTPAEASERPSGRERLARGLAALVEAQERRPPTAAEACLLRGFEMMLGVQKRRQRKPRQSSPDGLKTAAQAATKLNCSIKTLNAHVAAGDLRYVIIGKGTKRPHRMYAAADLDEFIANQTRKVTPACPSTAGRARHTGTSISGAEVIDFRLPRKQPTNGKQKK